jgi:hypothetical protein
VSGEPAPDGPGALERALDRPERALLRLPWPSTARIILKGSLGFVRQILRGRRMGLRAGPPTGPPPSAA